MANRKKAGRIAFLAEQWGPRVQACLPTEGSRTRLEDRLARSEDGAFRHLARLDPTPRKACLQRLCRWFCEGAFRMEDGRRVRDLLTRFEEDKPRLPVERRDINRHAAPGDLQEALDDLDGIRRADPLSFAAVPPVAAAACTTIASGRGWLIVRLDGLAASEHFADGTSWCTRHKGMFESHLGKGPIYVMVGRASRVQVHLASGQIRDELDRWAGPAVMAGFPDEAIAAMSERLHGDFRRKDARRGLAFPLEGGQWSVIECLESRGQASRASTGNGFGFVRADGTWILSWTERQGRLAFTVRSPDSARRTLDPEGLLSDPVARGLMVEAFEAHLAPAHILVALGSAVPRMHRAASQPMESLRLARCLASLDALGDRAREALSALGANADGLAGDLGSSPVDALSILTGLSPGSEVSPVVARAARRDRFAEVLGALENGRGALVLRQAMLSPAAVDPDALASILWLASHPAIRPSNVRFYARQAEKFLTHLQAVSSSPNRDAILPHFAALARDPDLAEAVTEGLAQDVGLLVQTLMLLDGMDGDPEVQGVVFSLAAVAATRVDGGEKMFAVPPAEVMAALSGGGPLPRCGDVFPLATLAEMVLASHAGLSMRAGDARDLLLSRARPAFARVYAAVGYDPSLRLLVRLADVPVDPEDVLDVLTTPFTGHLMVALAPADRDAATFERAASLGRGSAISALPAQGIEAGLVARLVASGEVLPMVERACATRALVEAVEATVDEASPPCVGAFVNVAGTVHLLGNGGIPELVPAFARYEESLGKGAEPEPDGRLEMEVTLSLGHGDRLARAFLPPVLDGRIPPSRVTAVLSQAVLLRPSLLDEVPGLVSVLTPQERGRVALTDAGSLRHFGVNELTPSVMAGFAQQAGDADGYGVDTIGERLRSGPSGLAAWTLAVERIGRWRPPRQSQARAILSCCPEPTDGDLLVSCVRLVSIGGLASRPRRPDGRPWGLRTTARVAARALRQVRYNPLRLMEGVEC